MMLSLVMHGFPEYRLYEEQFVEELLSLAHGSGDAPLREPCHDLWIRRGHADERDQYGRGKVRQTRPSPVTNLLAFGLDTVMAGYMRAAMVLILADTAYQVSQTLHERQGRQQQEDFFYSTAIGSWAVDAATLEAANSSYTWSKWSLAGRLAMDTMFFYRPMAMGMLTRMGDATRTADMIADGKAFDIMHAADRDFGKVEPTMKIARALRSGQPVGEVIVEKAAGGEGRWLKVENGDVVGMGPPRSALAEATASFAQAT